MSGASSPSSPTSAVPTKTCSKCLIEKPLTEFHRNTASKDGLRGDCKACSCARSAKWNEENKDKCRARLRRIKYGINQDQYNQMLEAQNGRCAICGTGDPGGKGSWHVDHCHTSGKVRGLLCHHCNLGIGHLRDDISTLEKAILYLKRHQ